MALLRATRSFLVGLTVCLLAGCAVCSSATSVLATESLPALENSSWFVSASGGVDNVTCGASPDTPCATIGFTWERASKSAADRLQEFQLAFTGDSFASPFVVLLLNACGGVFSTPLDRNLTFTLDAVSGLRLEAWWPSGCSKMTYPTAQIDLRKSSGAFFAATVTGRRRPSRQASRFFKAGLTPYLLQLWDLTISNGAYDPALTYFVGVHTDSALSSSWQSNLKSEDAEGAGLLSLNRTQITGISAKPIKVNPARLSLPIKKDETERERWTRTAHQALAGVRGLRPGRLPLVFLSEAAGMVSQSTFSSNLLTTFDAIFASAAVDHVEVGQSTAGTVFLVDETTFSENGNCTIGSFKGSVARPKVDRPSLRISKSRVSAAGDGFFLEHGAALEVQDSDFLDNKGDCLITCNVSKMLIKASLFRSNAGSAYLSELAPLLPGSVPQHRVGPDAFESASFEGLHISAAHRSGVTLVHSASISNCHFTGNSAHQRGGALRVESDRIIRLGSNKTKPVTVSCSHCEFIGNTALVDGGAVSITGGSVVLTFKHSNFTRNFAAGNGGAVSLSGGHRVSRLALDSVHFLKNSANKNGGAVMCGGQTVHFDKNGSGCSFDKNVVAGDVANEIGCADGCAVSGLPPAKLKAAVLGEEQGDSPAKLSVSSLCDHKTDIGAAPNGDIASPVKFWSYLGIAGGVVLGIILVAAVFIKWRRNVQMPTTRYVIAPGDDEDEGSE